MSQKSIHLSTTTTKMEFFRFLDLPKELRFMVYGMLDISTNRYKSTLSPHDHSTLGVSQDSSDTNSACSSTPETHPSMILVTQSMPVQILATCRLVHTEATPLLQPKLARLLSSVPTITLDDKILYTPLLSGPDGLLPTILAYLNTHCDTQFLPFQTWREQQAAKHDEQVWIWIRQTVVRLLSQATKPTVSWFGDLLHPEVRILLQVRRAWEYPTTAVPETGACSPNARRDSVTTPLQDTYTEDIQHAMCTPPLYSISTTTQLTKVFNDSLEAARSKGLEHVRGGSIVFGQDVREKGERGVVPDRICGLNYQLDG
ncbi:hypothetical protein P153DRAFT_432074 [Dothidotthia symphoricarpi CBS 119687]|uniref:F-box domain-containing protein n=1 Tax=Dothidotthia symphoricarpi CBS 119687 TaxID=1392245 RepID=A0A6A6ABZ6_9PLEO|nr:uncharacterized protein P153DRAFT_432074 [Dothidotthia symphoricarpi CBS 119687]KAF2128418.1 hypothetical protein P153DRAFT_432074 [Dothidotthia symphoricarpi CBS 119687]